VVAGGDRVEPEEASPFVQAIELQVTVALDARVRGHTDPVRLDVGLDDPRRELLGEVEHDVVDAQLLSDPAGVVDVGHAATPGVALAAPKAHGDANNIMALITKNECGNRRINPAGHC
jgi:hypothetical protein